jgi:hypothetical protein
VDNMWFWDGKRNVIESRDLDLLTDILFPLCRSPRCRAYNLVYVSTLDLSFVERFPQVLEFICEAGLVDFIVGVERIGWMAI